MTDLFITALEYAQLLWSQARPARSILALCRAMYIDPGQLAAETVPPYRAYRWILGHYRGHGFLGNPRISFFHQATRMATNKRLFRQRAWALWHLTIVERPGMPADPCESRHKPPGMDELAVFLDANGLRQEGQCFLQAIA